MPVKMEGKKNNVSNDSVNATSQRTRLKRKPRVLFSQVIMKFQLLQLFLELVFNMSKVQFLYSSTKQVAV